MATATMGSTSLASANGTMVRHSSSVLVSSSRAPRPGKRNAASAAWVHSGFAYAGMALGAALWRATLKRQQRGGAVGMPTATPDAAGAAPAQDDALPASAAGDYVVSFGSYASAADADKVIAALKAAGLTAYREAVPLNGREAQRVRVGPFADRAMAESARLRAVQVNAAVASLDSLTQQNAAMVEETTAYEKKRAENGGKLTIAQRSHSSTSLRLVSTKELSFVRNSMPSSRTMAQVPFGADAVVMQEQCEALAGEGLGAVRVNATVIHSPGCGLPSNVPIFRVGVPVTENRFSTVSM